MLTQMVFASFVLAARRSTSTHRPTLNDVKLACRLSCQGLCVIHFRYWVLRSKRTVFVPSLLVMTSRELGVKEAIAPTIRADLASAADPRATSTTPTNAIVRASITCLLANITDRIGGITTSNRLLTPPTNASRHRPARDASVRPFARSLQTKSRPHRRSGSAHVPSRRRERRPARR